MERKMSEAEYIAFREKKAAEREERRAITDGTKKTKRAPVQTESDK